MTIADILRAGKARIETKGWGQGNDTIPPRGAYCVLTAITGPSAYYPDDAILMFERANGLNREADFGALSWNDAPGRTKEEVLAAFDKAITLAEQENA